MKTFLLIVLIIILIVPALMAEGSDVRKLRWGMSVQEVKKIEGLTEELYKTEEIMGMEVEVVFGFNLKSLDSVIYSCNNLMFPEKVGERLEGKYGEPTMDLDYSFLLDAQKILKRYPIAVIDILEHGDSKALSQVTSGYSDSGENRIIKGGLSKRRMWEFDNTVLLLLEHPTGGILSYRPKASHYANKEKFSKLVAEIRVLAAKQKKKQEEDDNL